MKTTLALLALMLLGAGCYSSPVADFERDSPYDLGNPNLPPTDVKAVVYNEDRFLISWTHIAQGAIGAVVEQQINDGPFTKVGEVSNFGTFVFTTIPAPGRYVFRVAAERADHSFGPYGYADTLSTNTPPTFVAATVIDAATFGVSWGTTNKWVSTVIVEMKRDNQPFVEVAQVERNVRFAPVSLPGPGSYTFRVASQSTDGLRGPYRYTGTFTTVFPPLTVAATQLDNATFGVSWSGVLPWTSAVRVERKRDNEPFVLVGEVEVGVRFLPVPISGPGSYTFRVTPRLTDGSLGPPSTTGTFTVR